MIYFYISERDNISEFGIFAVFISMKLLVRGGNGFRNDFSAYDFLAFFSKNQPVFGDSVRNKNFFFWRRNDKLYFIVYFKNPLYRPRIGVIVMRMR